MLCCYWQSSHIALKLTDGKTWITGIMSQFPKWWRKFPARAPPYLVKILIRPYMHLFSYRQRSLPSGSPCTATAPFFPPFFETVHLLTSNTARLEKVTVTFCHCHFWVQNKSFKQQLLIISAAQLTAELLNNCSYLIQPRNGEFCGKYSA